VPAPGSTSSLLQAPSRGTGYAVALRWTALTPAPTFDAFDLLNTARSWSQFRKAGESLAVPAQNLLYADVNGNIGYQAPGAIPVREGYDGKWPVPGWDSRYRWKGTVPFEALPSVLNPPEGWIVTANQAVIGPDYPYFLTDDWAYGARSQRIVDLVTAATADGAKVSPEQLRQIQMDSWNELAAFLAPKLVALPTTDQTAEAVALLEDWDFTQPTDSAPAALFNAVWRQMVTRMFDSAADTDLIYASGGDRYWQVVEDIWADPNAFWWDDRTVGGRQSRDETLQASIVAAVQELSDLQGSNPAGWTWGGLHTLELTNQTLGTSGIAPIEWLFNRGPLEVAGGEAIVNATGWTPKNGYVVDWVPSMRQVVDLANFDNSTWVNLTGASGHAFNANYVDQAEAWRTGEQYPWAFSRNAIEESTVDVLTLKPASS
jgi:penicillin amidase